MEERKVKKLDYEELVNVIKEGGGSSVLIYEVIHLDRNSLSKKWTIQELVDASGKTRNTVKRVCGFLVDRGYLIKPERHRDGRGSKQYYYSATKNTANTLSYSLYRKHVVYFLSFENAPGLIKIGRSKNLLNRVPTLERDYGKIVPHESFVFWGEDQKKKFSLGMERGIHAILESKCMRVHEHEWLLCKDGGTEFFNNKGGDVMKEVENLLAGIDKPYGKEARLDRLSIHMNDTEE